MPRWFDNYAHRVSGGMLTIRNFRFGGESYPFIEYNMFSFSLNWFVHFLRNRSRFLIKLKVLFSTIAHIFLNKLHFHDEFECYYTSAHYAGVQGWRKVLQA